MHRRAKLTPAMQKVPKIDTLDALGDAIFYNRDNNLDKVNRCLARYRPALLAELPHSEVDPKLFPHSTCVKFL